MDEEIEAVLEFRSLSFPNKNKVAKGGVWKELRKSGLLKSKPASTITIKYSLLLFFFTL